MFSSRIHRLKKRRVSCSGIVPRSHRSRSVAVSSPRASRNAHSQTIATRHPSSSSFCRLFRSRTALPSSFVFQYCACDVGVVAKRQPGCLCQKQPCTKHTAWYFRKTKSGVPGRPLSCNRYRNRRRYIARRRSSSGPLFFARILDIVRDRVSRSIMSRTNSHLPHGRSGATVLKSFGGFTPHYLSHIHPALRWNNTRNVALLYPKPSLLSRVIILQCRSIERSVQF